VAYTSAVVAALWSTVTTKVTSSWGTSTWAVSADVTWLTTLVALSTTGSWGETSTGTWTSWALGRDVTLLTTGVTGLSRPWLRASLAQMTWLTTLVAGWDTSGWASLSDVGWITTVEATSWTSTTEHFVII
jgi:hypothetical protein